MLGKAPLEAHQGKQDLLSPGQQARQLASRQDRVCQAL